MEQWIDVVEEYLPQQGLKSISCCFFLHFISVSKIYIVIQSLQRSSCFGCCFRVSGEKKKNCHLFLYKIFVVLVIELYIHIVIFFFCIFYILLTRSNQWSIFLMSKLIRMDQHQWKKKTRKLKNLNLLIRHQQRKSEKIVKLVENEYVF